LARALSSSSKSPPLLQCRPASWSRARASPRRASSPWRPQSLASGGETGCSGASQAALPGPSFSEEASSSSSLALITASHRAVTPLRCELRGRKKKEGVHRCWRNAQAAFLSLLRAARLHELQTETGSSFDVVGPIAHPYPAAAQFGARVASARTAAAAGPPAPPHRGRAVVPAGPPAGPRRARAAAAAGSPPAARARLYRRRAAPFTHASPVLSLTMKLVTLGSSDLLVSNVCLGTMYETLARRRSARAEQLCAHALGAVRQ